MSGFIKDSKKNEFMRDNVQKNGMNFSFLHKLIPAAIIIISLIIANQFCCFQFGYNPRIIGYPWFVINNSYPVYFPFNFFVLIIRGIKEQNNTTGHIIFNSVMIWVIGITIAVITYFILTWARTAFQKDQNIHGTARWATPKDIKNIGLYEEAGVVVGQENTAKVNYKIEGGGVTLELVKAAPILRHKGATSTIMFAPSRSGKGVSSVIPTCIEWPHSLITVDPKGENFAITAGWRRKFSNIYRVSPCSRDTLCFNILNEITEDTAFRDASMIAEILATPADGKVDGNSKHWVDTAKDLLTGAILHIKCCDKQKDKSLYGVLNFLSQATKGGQDDKDKGSSLLNSMITSNHCNETIGNIIANVARRNLARPDQERGSVFSTAVTALQVFEDPLVRYCSSSSDFFLDDFKESETPISLYLTIPFSDLARLSSYIRIIITFILRKFSQDETQFGDIKLKHPILFLIDEFPTLGAFPVLEEMMGILAGYGITFYLICQTPQQIYKLYSEHTPIFDHCKFIMTYAMSDPKGAEMFSKMLGVKSVSYTQISNSGSRHQAGTDNINISEQTQQTNLMNADEIQHLPANQLLVLPQGSPPILAKKNVYYSDPRYTSKVNLPVPKNRNELLFECVNTKKPDPNKKQWFDVPQEVYMTAEDAIEEPVFESHIPTDEELININRKRTPATV